MHPVNRIDRFVGGQVRLRRIQLGMERGELAAALNLSEPALRDYEAGRARILAPLVFRICRQLNIPSQMLYDGLVPRSREPAPGKRLCWPT
jgi:transcriptional regulator with XRE-family HTH domain